MPVIKSAKKKLRQDKTRTQANKTVIDQVKKLIKKAKRETSEKAIILAVKSIDKAAKKHILHKNKAARLKSQLSRLTRGKEEKKTPEKKTRMSKKIVKK